MGVDGEIGRLAGDIDGAFGPRGQRARGQSEAERRAVLRPVERQPQMQRAEIRQRRKAGQHATGRLVEVHLRGEVIPGQGGLSRIDAAAAEIAERQMRLRLVMTGDLGVAGQRNVDRGGLGDGFGNRNPVHRQLAEEHLHRQRRDGCADRPRGWFRLGGRRGRRQPCHRQRVSMQPVDHHHALQQGRQRQPQVEPGQRQPRAVCVQQFEAREVQVGRDRAGETRDTEGAAAMRIRERDDLALAGRRVDGGDDAAHKQDDQKQQDADRDAEPLRHPGQDPHQNACPMPI